VDKSNATVNDPRVVVHKGAFQKNAGFGYLVISTLFTFLWYSARHC
jgi:hypothetical protein